MRSQNAAYVRQYADRGVCFQVQSVLAKLSLCRTRALGGHTWQCDDCGELTEVFHTCGDRHCPQCSGRKRYDFADRAEQLILPGVTYYQVVFTLPGELSQLALANREVIADLLFTSAATSLRTTIDSEQGYESAAMMVLHTWNQQLQPHWHVHALVPGGGPSLPSPSLTGDHWKSAQSPPDAANSDGFYLVKAVSLREKFRKSAMTRLRKLYKQQKLKLVGKFAYLQDERAWQAFCEELKSVDWVSFIQPPPTATSTAEQVVRYLTRYLTGGPISDSRITAADANHVTFMAREGKRIGGDREQVPVTLTTLEFVRRWCDHIQPDQLTKTRYFGGWCNRLRTKYQARCRRLLGISEVTEDRDDSADEIPSPLGPLSQPGLLSEAESVDDSLPQCVGCGGRKVRLIKETAQPSWSALLTHLHADCPAWYAKSEYQEFCDYLDREHGISYEDWYAEMRIESAMRVRPVRPAEQFYFPGLFPERDFTIESY